MLKKRNTESFAKELAKEFGVTQKSVKSLLSFSMKNVCRMIARGEEVNLDHFGHFYFNKKAYGAYLKKGRELANEKRNSNQSGTPGTNK